VCWKRTIGRAEGTPPDVPDAIQVRRDWMLWCTPTQPDHNLHVSSRGDGKFTWTLKAPDAELHDRQDKVIGRHSAVPRGVEDGSEVTGKARRTSIAGCGFDSVAAVNVVSHAGKGLLSNVTMIQRVHTHGGKVQGGVRCSACQRGDQEQLHCGYILRSGQVMRER